MTRKERELLVKELKQGLAIAEVKYNETPDNVAWCYGYLIGTINKAIRELE